MAGSLTLGIVKPDAVATGKTGKIVAHLQDAGLHAPRRPPGAPDAGRGRARSTRSTGSARSTPTWCAS